MTALTPANVLKLRCTNSMGGHPLSANGAFPMRFSLGQRPKNRPPQAVVRFTHQNAATLLHVEDLNARYGNTTAVAPMSFSPSPGQTLALVGESAACKTSTALALCGFVPRDPQVRGEGYHHG